jgi:hypothetical protein
MVVADRLLETAEHIARSIDDPRQKGRIPHVTGRRHRSSTGAFDRGRSTSEVVLARQRMRNRTDVSTDVDEQNVRAGFGQPQNVITPQPTPGADHESNLSRKVEADHVALLGFMATLEATGRNSPAGI